LLFICVVQRCTNDHSGNGAEWCATSVTRDGAVIPGEWGDCDFDNIHCRYSAPVFIGFGNLDLIRAMKWWAKSIILFLKH
jgi:hypothetical protein